ncbi:MAG TPA: fibrobacter succinogenes major paralogous domain-containing protein [Bacteroidales bacterium]|nr:fibrobacter succinogenes major paralogous domain-containing protein [Bacteroidales bacterium]
MKKSKVILSVFVIGLVTLISACNSGDKNKEDDNTENQEQKFESVEIGQQEWMLLNLDTDTFANGDLIPEAKTEAEWQEAKANKKAAWCFYNNKSSNAEKYGRLYNWYAVSDERGLAPKGWHVPTDKEIKKLLEYLGNENEAFVELVEDGDSGFKALYSGWRRGTGAFADETKFCSFWTTTENGEYGAWSLDIDKGNRNAVIGYSRKEFGLSVRCIKD